ncbi:Two-component response regulator [Granulibacter bethesdensis]|uniref:Regulatory protein VirG n=2 Tax=Granulibacter bethesdensis TaxID=364410 RepID=Q0BQV4_GRABC|nr:Two-component response regulator [Granulibacter bethesdensis CGDNIH1]AHJ68252.1 Two-component response regulator [Granulibacter bethesdensis]APH65351.1 Two-component response regulator [Granulibacter bethesdensis]
MFMVDQTIQNAMTAENAGAPYILVVEDDPGMRVLIMRVLRENGFRTSAVRDGREMWPSIEQLMPDLILMDVMLPGGSGFDLCKALRQSSQVPIIMVSARGEEMDRVLGLELGADDYIAKPFGKQELLARVRAVLRRGPVNEPTAKGKSETISFAGWQIDMKRRELTDPSGAVVDLSGAEYDLLLSFLENAQRVIGRDRLLELSRTRLGDVSDRSIDVLVSRLRRKIGNRVGERPLIRTIRGVGYMFAADVERE